MDKHIYDPRVELIDTDALTDAVFAHIEALDHEMKLEIELFDDEFTDYDDLARRVATKNPADYNQGEFLLALSCFNQSEDDND